MLGLPLAVGAGRLLSAQLYGVKFWDPLALGVAAVSLGACAFFAAIIPGRARGVDFADECSSLGVSRRRSVRDVSIDQRLRSVHTLIADKRPVLAPEVFDRRAVARDRDPRVSA